MYAKTAVCRSFWSNRLRQPQKRKNSWSLERQKRVERQTGRSLFVARLGWKLIGEKWPDACVSAKETQPCPSRTQFHESNQDFFW